MIRLHDDVKSIIKRHVDPTKRLDKQFELCWQEINREGHGIYVGRQYTIFLEMVISEFTEITGQLLAIQILMKESVRQQFAASNPYGLDKIDRLKRSVDA